MGEGIFQHQFQGDTTVGIGIFLSWESAQMFNARHELFENIDEFFSSSI